MELARTSSLSDSTLTLPSQQLRSQRHVDHLFMAAFGAGIVIATLAWTAILVRSAIWLLWQ